MSERLIKRGFYAILIALAVGVMHRQAHSEELMPNPPDSIVVVSQGSGSSRDEAVQHAIIEAANEALGMLVQGDVETDGNAVVKDRITSVTRGVVNKYDVLSDNTDEGQHTVRIRAVVASAPLYETAKSSGVQVYKVDGGRMFAEQVSVRNSVVNGRKLIYEAFSRISSDAVEAKVTEIKTATPDSDTTLVAVRYTVSLNGSTLSYANKLLDTYKSFVDNKVTSSSEMAITVMSPDIGFFSGSHMFSDVKMVSTVKKILSDQRKLYLKVIFKDQDGQTLGVSTDFYTTSLFGTMGEKSYPGDPPEVLVSGRSSEKRVRFVQVPVSMLDKISSIEVTPGWETPTLPGKDASDSPSNVLPSGGAVIRNSAYVPK